MKTVSNGPSARADRPKRPLGSDWQLPAGVPRSIWEYAESESIATEYDEYFQQHGLLALDHEICARFAGKEHVVADLGCGTGRSLLPLARQGATCLAVDLSAAMLAEVRRKAMAEGLVIHPVRANLVDLDCIADRSVNLALCLFSTLGMISGDVHRRQCLQHVGRILRPGGYFVVHVHNYWYNVRDPGGPAWLLGNLWRAMVRRSEELGDRRYDYRGVRRFFLHAFRRRELAGLLRDAGLRPTEWTPVGIASQGRLPYPRWLTAIRATGWVVVCRKEP